MTTTNGVVSGTTTAPASGGPYFYRARHNNQNLPNVPARGSTPNNSWQPETSNSQQVTLLTDETAPTTTLTVGTPKSGAERFRHGRHDIRPRLLGQRRGHRLRGDLLPGRGHGERLPQQHGRSGGVGGLQHSLHAPGPRRRGARLLLQPGYVPNRETVKSRLHFRDTAAPETTATATANAAAYISEAWTRFNVTLDLNAADGAGQAGVREITYSASGATTIAATTVTGASASVPAISAEGTTT